MLENHLKNPVASIQVNFKGIIFQCLNTNLFIFSVARVRELEEEVQSLTNQLTSKNAENENLASQLEELHSSYSLTRQKSVNLEGSNDKYVLITILLRKQNS